MRGNVRVAFARPFILVLAVVYFANQVNSVAIQYNFPSIVESLDISGSFTVAWSAAASASAPSRACW